MTTPVGSLPAATSITAADYIPVEQAGILKRATPDLLPFTQSGSGTTTPASGAIATSVARKLQSSAPVDAKIDFGAVGDDSTDDTTAIQNWLNQGQYRPLFLPKGIYKITSKLTTTGGSTIFGSGQNQSIFKKYFNGDMFDWADKVALVDIGWAGNGATYTGSIATISAGSSQAMLRTRMTDSASNPVKWTAANIGTQFEFLESQVWSTTLTNAAFLFNASDTSTFTKGTMVGIDCEGGALYDCNGGLASFRAIACTCTGIVTYATDLNVTLIGCRFATNDVYIKGTNHAVVGCQLAGDLYLDAGATLNAIGPNSFAAGKGVTDNSALTTNKIYDGIMKVPGLATFSGNVVLTGGPTVSVVGSNLSVGGGFNISGAATLPAANSSLIASFETPVTRFYVGDGTGYSWRLAKRTGSVTTDYFVVTDSGVANVAANVATPAAGSASAVLIFGTTSGFGIYYGSSAPTVSAAKGSLYLRSDGTGTTDRMYVNTNGATTWTAVATVA